MVMTRAVCASQGVGKEREGRVVWRIVMRKSLVVASAGAQEAI